MKTSERFRKKFEETDAEAAWTSPLALDPKREAQIQSTQRQFFLMVKKKKISTYILVFYDVVRPEVFIKEKKKKKTWPGDIISCLTTAALQKEENLKISPQTSAGTKVQEKGEW